MPVYAVGLWNGTSAMGCFVPRILTATITKRWARFLFVATPKLSFLKGAKRVNKSHPPHSPAFRRGVRRVLGINSYPP